jgi:hypothetical protein
MYSTGGLLKVLKHAHTKAFSKLVFFFSWIFSQKFSASGWPKLLGISQSPTP